MLLVDVDVDVDAACEAVALPGLFENGGLDLEVDRVRIVLVDGAEDCVFATGATRPVLFKLGVR